MITNESEGYEDCFKKKPAIPKSPSFESTIKSSLITLCNLNLKLKKRHAFAILVTNSLIVCESEFCYNVKHHEFQ
jgi:hypothetical protein